MLIAGSTFRFLINYFQHLSLRGCSISQRFFFSMSQRPTVGQDLVIFEASRSHPPHSVGLLWKSDEPDAVNSTGQHATLTRDRLSCPRRISNPQSQQASSHRLTRGHWDRHVIRLAYTTQNVSILRGICVIFAVLQNAV